MFKRLLLGNKPTSLENMKSYFLTSVLITQSITLISRPLPSTVFNQLTLGISSNKRQNTRNYFSVCFSNNQVKTLISQPFFCSITS
ncbi:hypothetical protein CUS44_04160 [Enterococcus faecium]|nr:hypothetical protein CUS44_04160 [Enterococcus faecium]